MTAQPCLYINLIKSLPIPLPPLAEQHRIVAKMDELTALCDRLEAAQAERESRRDRVAAASLRRLNKPDDAPTLREHARFHLRHLPRLTTRPEHIQQLRQTILKLAVRGRLVPQDPNDEPASELLKRIQAEKERHAKKGHIKEQEPLLNVRLDEAWFAIPSSWCWVRLGMITQIVMGQSPPGATYNKTGEGIPLINGPVEFTEGPFGKTLINQYTTAPTNLCEEGDLLLCVRGSTTGRTNIAGFRACIGRGVAAIRPIFADHYVRLFIWRLRASIIGMGRGIAFPSVSRKQIEELPVPLPPLAEQQRIVAKVEELMTLCDRLETQLTTAQTESRRLLEAALHQALTPTC
jgi:type I restriction enzyme S subunit